MNQSLFNALQERQAGIFLHLTSLPNSQGIGNLGESAYRFIDALKASGIGVWQMCPWGPTTYSNSPYQCSSSFAGNPYLINLEALREQGLLKNTDALAHFHQDRVDFGTLYREFYPLLREAFNQFDILSNDADQHKAFERFCAQEVQWLKPYALFEALKQHFDQAPFSKWPAGYRSYAKALKKGFPKSVLENARAHSFYQFLFHEQWAGFKQYARQSGISLLGDIALYVGPDSADVWAQPELFQVNAQGEQSGFAGYPPDYFSPEGQFWKNPLYRWDQHKKTAYRWWIQRLEHGLRLFDALRLDHFQGFARYWSIPQDANTAARGTWKKGPGLDFFKALQASFPQGPFVIEDLGQENLDAEQLKAETGLPGMTVLQFAFGSDSKNPYLPHNQEPNSIVYTGTHDSDTTAGWLQSCDAETLTQMRHYFALDQDAELHWALIRSAYQSVSRLAIIPMQDILELDTHARFNLPGTPSGNWEWRLTQAQFKHFQSKAQDLKAMALRYGRLKNPAG